MNKILRTISRIGLTLTLLTVVWPGMATGAGLAQAGQPGTLALTKTVDTAGPVAPGGIVNYTLTLTHTGGTAPAATEIKDVLPAGVIFLGPFSVQTQGAGAIPQTARFRKGKAGWQGMIAPDSTLTISFPVRVRPCPDATPRTVSNTATASQTDGSQIQATATFAVDCASGPLLSNVQLTAGFIADGSLVQTTSLLPGQGLPLHLEVTNNNSTAIRLGLALDVPEEVRLSQPGFDASSKDPIQIFRLKAGETRQIEPTLRLTQPVADGTALTVSLTACLLIGEEYVIDCDSQSWPPLTLIVTRRDLGDAPDSSNHPGAPMTAYPGRPANFPTVRDTATGSPPGPAHLHPRFFHLGRRVSLEAEADLGPDQDPTNNMLPGANISNRDRADDGIRPQLLNFSHCQPATFHARIFIHPLAVAYFANKDADGKANLNVWLDANRDGDWADALNCPPLAPEHIVVDQQIDPVALGPGLHTITVTTTGPVPWPANQAEQPAWLRVTLSDIPSEKPAGQNYGDGRGAPAPYHMGETEDYLLNGPVGDPTIALSGQALPAFINNTGQLSAQALRGSWVTQWSLGVTNLEQIKKDGPPFQLELEWTGCLTCTIAFNDEPGVGIQGRQNGNKVIYTVDPALADLAALEEIRVNGSGAVSSSPFGPDLSGIFETTARARVIVGGEVKTTVEAEITAGPAAPVLVFVTPGGPARLAGATCSNTIKLVGRAAPGAAVTVWEDTGIVHSTTAGPNGHWSGVVNLPDGFHQLYATQEISGRTSPASNIIAILIGLLTSQPDLSTLSFTGPAGFYALPEVGDEVLVYLKPGESYTVSVARCGDDPTTQLIFDSPASGPLVLAGPNGDGLYQGNFTYEVAGHKAAGPTPFTLTAISGNTEVVVEGQLRRSDDHQIIVQDAVTGQPLPGSTATILSPRDAASGLPAGKRFFDIWPGDLFGQPNPYTTEADGGFFFQRPPGSYQVDIFQAGYQPYRHFLLPYLEQDNVAEVIRLTPLISQPAAQTIWIDEAGFNPPVVEVSPGQVVEFTGLDLESHTATAASVPAAAGALNGAEWESGWLGPGQSYRRRFDTPGLYTFVDQTNPANTVVIMVEASTIYLPVVVK